MTDLLDTRMSTAGLKAANTVDGDNLPVYEGASALNWLSNYRLYVDGVASGKGQNTLVEDLSAQILPPASLRPCKEISNGR